MNILQTGCSFFLRINRKIFVFILLVIAGLFAGIIIGIKENPFDPIIFQTHLSESSFFLCLFSQLIPVLIIIIVILLSIDYIYYLLLFFNFLCRGYCGAIVLSSLRSCAWLIRLLLLFPGIIKSFLMIWVLIKHSNGKQKSFLSDIILICFLLFIAAVLNTFIFCGQYNSFINFL